MFIFKLAGKYNPNNLIQQIAINPKNIAAIFQEKDPSKPEDNVLTIILSNDKQYTVYYSDFDTLVRLVDERR